MNPRLVPWLAISIAASIAAGLAWVMLRGGDHEPEVELGAEAHEHPRQPPTAPAAPPSRMELPAPPPPAPEGATGPEWITTTLDVPAGDRTLTGRDLIRAIEGAGTWKVEGAEPGVLDALSEATLEAAQRGRTEPYAAVIGWLKDAGFHVEARGNLLVISRRPDPEGGLR